MCDSYRGKPAQAELCLVNGYTNCSFHSAVNLTFAYFIFSLERGELLGFSQGKDVNRIIAVL